MNTPYQRRQRDWLIAAAIATVAAVAAGVVYLNSDIRATTVVTGPTFNPGQPLQRVPSRLAVDWQQPTDPSIGAAVSAFGTVVTADQHTVFGRDPDTGAIRWSYGRSNKQLCKVGSNDISTLGSDGHPLSYSTPQGGVDPYPIGVLAVHATDGMCQEVVLLDPRTGERRYQRTSPGERDGNLIWGAQYTGWVSPNRAEVWRWDLLRTVQYGSEPAPDNPGGEHVGCTITDAAIADNQFGTIEHCPKQGDTARIQLTWSDPGAAEHKSDPRASGKNFGTYKHQSLMDVDTASKDARIVGITHDRVAVLVAQPSPAIVTYDPDGSIVSRTPVAIPSSTIGHAGLTPRITLSPTDPVQYSLVGGYLLAIDTVNKSTKVTTTATTAAPPRSQDVVRVTPQLRWVTQDAIGLPAAVGKQLVVPIKGGLHVVDTATGRIQRTLDVPRPANTARVDIALDGGRLVETRGSEVVALKPTT